MVLITARLRSPHESPVMQSQAGRKGKISVSYKVVISVDDINHEANNSMRVDMDIFGQFFFGLVVLGVVIDFLVILLAVGIWIEKYLP